MDWSWQEGGKSGQEVMKERGWGNMHAGMGSLHMLGCVTAKSTGEPESEPGTSSLKSPPSAFGLFRFADPCLRERWNATHICSGRSRTGGIHETEWTIASRHLQESIETDCWLPCSIVCARARPAHSLEQGEVDFCGNRGGPWCGQHCGSCGCGRVDLVDPRRKGLRLVGRGKPLTEKFCAHEIILRKLIRRTISAVSTEAGEMDIDFIAGAFSTCVCTTMDRLAFAVQVVVYLLRCQNNSVEDAPKRISWPQRKTGEEIQRPPAKELPRPWGFYREEVPHHAGNQRATVGPLGSVPLLHLGSKHAPRRQRRSVFQVQSTRFRTAAFVRTVMVGRVRVGEAHDSSSAC